MNSENNIQLMKKGTDAHRPTSSSGRFRKGNTLREEAAKIPPQYATWNLRPLAVVKGVIS